MTNPKPCPFCGSDEVRVVEGSTIQWCAVECTNCFSTGPEVPAKISGTGTIEEWENKAKADAVAEWNKRTAGD